MRWRRNEMVGRARKVGGSWVLRPQRINDEADNAEPDDGDDNPEMKQSANKVHALSPARRVASSPKDRIQAGAIRVAFSCRVVADQANSAAPDSVSFTCLPLSCSQGHPRSIAGLRPALYSAGLPLNSCRNGTPAITSVTYSNGDRSFRVCNKSRVLTRISDDDR
jgi:hypothetical protein